MFESSIKARVPTYGWVTRSSNSFQIACSKDLVKRTELIMCNKACDKRISELDDIQS